MDQIKTGVYIQDKRKQIGMTQEQLAEAVEVSTKTVSNWENGNWTSIKSDNQRRLAEVLNVSITELMLGEDLPDLTPETKERISRQFEELEAKVENVQNNTMRTEDRGLVSIELGFYSFGVAVIALATSWLAVFPRTIALIVISSALILFGICYMIFGKAAIKKIERRTKQERDKKNK